MTPSRAGPSRDRQRLQQQQHSGEDNGQGASSDSLRHLPDLPYAPPRGDDNGSWRGVGQDAPPPPTWMEYDAPDSSSEAAARRSATGGGGEHGYGSRQWMHEDRERFAAGANVDQARSGGPSGSGAQGGYKPGDGYGEADEVAGVNRSLQEAARMVARSKGKERALEDEWSFGPPLAVRDGMFAGKVLRFAVQCVQQPVHGRRKTEKDRRALAPVPVVRIRIRECHPTARENDWIEEEMDISTLEPSYLVCAAELSDLKSGEGDAILDPRPTEGPPDVRGTSQPWSGGGGATSGGGSNRPDFHPHASYEGVTNPARDPLYPVYHVEPGSHSSPARSALKQRASWVADGHWDTSSLRSSGPPPTQTSFRVPNQPERLRRRLRREGDESETSGDEAEGDNRTPKRVRAGKKRALFGSLHVSAVRVPDPDGVLCLWFLFTDLCVRYEGTYSLKFRAFDLSVIVPDTPDVPDIGSCTSQTFKVFSPRNFPGLPKPTELSEHFVKQGFKLNTRKNERIIKTPSPSPPPT